MIGSLKARESLQLGITFNLFQSFPVVLFVCDALLTPVATSVSGD